MANIIRKEENARALNLNLEEFDELINRMVGFLKNKPLNSGSLRDSFFIYREIINRSKLIEKKRWKTSNSEMRERGTEIEQLRNQGKGYGSIKKELSLNVSRGTIATFCTENNLYKDNKHG